jgi:hypothetical protein
MLHSWLCMCALCDHVRVFLPICRISCRCTGCLPRTASVIMDYLAELKQSRPHLRLLSDFLEAIVLRSRYASSDGKFGDNL